MNLAFVSLEAGRGCFKFRVGLACEGVQINKQELGCGCFKFRAGLAREGVQIINKQNELQQLFLAEATGQGNKHAHKCWLGNMFNWLHVLRCLHERMQLLEWL